MRGNFLGNCDSKFGEEKVAIILESILKAVNYCHAQNSTHRIIRIYIYIYIFRDLKLDNIMLSKMTN